ncbi:MAG: hypothetical protein MMC33_008483 [Icmadophila ericetorum]|nr:hypothetical protein [Icmadophila ericetorum]
MANFESMSSYCEEYQGAYAIILAWVLGATATILINLRVFDRKCFGNGLGWDDHMMILAVVFSIVDDFAFTIFFQAGIGRHILCLSEANVSTILKWLTITDVLDVAAVGCAKISVCLYIQRVLGNSISKLSLLLLRVLLGCIVLLHAADFLVFLLQCRPIQAIWDSQVPGTCYSMHTSLTFTYGISALDAFTDLICAALPIIVISRLQLNIRAKLAICVLMGLGVLTACCAIGKAITFRDFYVDDSSWAITTPSLWAVAETQLSVNLPSIPALRSLYIHLQKPKLHLPLSNPHLQRTIGSNDRKLDKFDHQEQKEWSSVSNNAMVSCTTQMANLDAGSSYHVAVHAIG